MTDTLTEAHVVERWPIALVRPAPDNPRTALGDLEAMAASIRSVGIIQPLTVVPTGELGEDDVEVVMVVAGHRRLGAAQLAELEDVPVIVRSDIDESTRLEMMFDENWHREDLNPIENALSVKLLADAGLKQAEIAERTGVTQPTVSKWMSLLKLPEKAQVWVVEEKMTQEIGVALAGLPTETIIELTEKGPPPDWRITQAKNQIEREKSAAKAKKDVADKGWSVLEDEPDWHQQQTLDGTDMPVAIDTDRDRPEGLLAHVDPVEHEHEKCHAVYLGDGEITPACTTPSNHPRPKGWKSPYDIKMAEIVAARGRGEKVPVPAQGGPNKWELDRAESAARAEIAHAKIEPITALCKVVVGEVGPDAERAVIDYSAKSLLLEEDWTFDRLAVAGELLGVDGVRSTPDLVAIMANPAIDHDGFDVLHASALAADLLCLEEVVDRLLAEVAIDDDDANREAVMGLFDHLAELMDNVPSFDEFVAGLNAVTEAEEPKAAAIYVELFKKAGTFRQRCSECGVLQGANKEEEYARQRGALHLTDTHGIEAGGVMSA